MVVKEACLDEMPYRFQKAVHDRQLRQGAKQKAVVGITIIKTLTVDAPSLIFMGMYED